MSDKPRHFSLERLKAPLRGRHIEHHKQPDTTRSMGDITRGRIEQGRKENDQHRKSTASSDSPTQISTAQELFHVIAETRLHGNASENLVISQRDQKRIARYQAYYERFKENNPEYSALLASIINGQYARLEYQAWGKPDPQKAIMVRPFVNKQGEQFLLVTADATDIFNWNSNNSLRAFQLGYRPSPDHPYLIDVDQTIRSFIKDNPEYQGTSVLMCGYSQGGMVSQELARQNYIGHLLAQTDHDFTPPPYRVPWVIAYGSPLTGPPVQDVSYTIFQATYDLVTYTSSWSLSQNFQDSDQKDTITQRWKLMYAEHEKGSATRFIDPHGVYGDQVHTLSTPGAKAHDRGHHISYKKHPDLQHFDIALLKDARPLAPAMYYEPSPEKVLQRAKDAKQRITRFTRHEKE